MSGEPREVKDKTLPMFQYIDVRVEQSLAHNGCLVMKESFSAGTVGFGTPRAPFCNQHHVVFVRFSLPFYNTLPEVYA